MSFSKSARKNTQWGKHWVSVIVAVKLFLTFWELTSFTCFLKTWFLTFYHTGITCKETSAFEWVAEVWVYLEEGTGDTLTDSSCLTSVATTENVYENIVLTNSWSNCEWLVDDKAKIRMWDIFFNIFFVYSNFTSSWNKANACNSVFTTSSTCILCCLGGILRIEEIE